MNILPQPRASRAQDLSQSEKGLDEQLRQAATAHPDARTRSVEVVGRRYWIKRCERLSGRLRLQKGNPARAFRRERAALHALAGTGLPVTRIVAEGPDYFVTPDAGPNLLEVLRDPATAPAEIVQALAAAGTALGALHQAGKAHGRPHLKDFCWARSRSSEGGLTGDHGDEGRITIIDFERYDHRWNTPRRMRNDLIMLVFSAHAEFLADHTAIDALCDAYRETAPPAIWPAAERFCRHIRWIEPLTRPLRRADGRRREFAAIPLTLRRFGVG